MRLSLTTRSISPLRIMWGVGVGLALAVSFAVGYGRGAADMADFILGPPQTEFETPAKNSPPPVYKAKTAV